MYKIEGKKQDNNRCSEEALVTIVGKAVVGVVSIGHVVIADAGAVGISTVIASYAVLSNEGGSAQIVCKPADVANVKVAGAWVVAAIAAMVSSASVNDASVIAAGAVVVFAHYLVCGAAAGVVVAFLWDLCLQLCSCVCIADFCA